jgi:hypothetical protein
VGFRTNSIENVSKPDKLMHPVAVAGAPVPGIETDGRRREHFRPLSNVNLRGTTLGATRMTVEHRTKRRRDGHHSREKDDAEQQLNRQRPNVAVIRLLIHFGTPADNSTEPLIKDRRPGGCLPVTADLNFFETGRHARTHF